MTERRLPTRFDLDAAVPERPTLLPLLRPRGRRQHGSITPGPASKVTGYSARRPSSRSRELWPDFNQLSSRKRSAGRWPVWPAWDSGASLPSCRPASRSGAAWPTRSRRCCRRRRKPDRHRNPRDRLDSRRTRGGGPAAPQGPPNVGFLGWKDFADGSLGGRTAALMSPTATIPKPPERSASIPSTPDSWLEPVLTSGGRWRSMPSVTWPTIGCSTCSRPGSALALPVASESSTPPSCRPAPSDGWPHWGSPLGPTGFRRVRNRVASQAIGPPGREDLPDS